MQCLVVFAIISAAATSSITYPLEHSILNTPCESFGVYKLQSRCENSNSEVVGFIKAAGAVVCCSDKTRWNAKSYCAEYGAETLSVLDFNVIGGEESEIGEFPHMAAIGYETIDKDITFDCGGALISEKFVISAAHCANRKDRRPKLVRLGRVRIIN